MDTIAHMLYVASKIELEQLCMQELLNRYFATFCTVYSNSDNSQMTIYHV